VKGKLPTAHPNIAARCSALPGDMLIRTRKDLLKFTLSPLEVGKECKSALRVNGCLSQPSRISKVSSAY